MTNPRLMALNFAQRVRDTALLGFRSCDEPLACSLAALLHCLTGVEDGHRRGLVPAQSPKGAVAGVVGIEGGVVSGVINLESSGVGASDWRPRHEKHYQQV